MLRVLAVVYLLGAVACAPLAYLSGQYVAYAALGLGSLVAFAVLIAVCEMREHLEEIAANTRNN